MTYIERIQVDLGFILSIIPKRLLYFLGIPLYRLFTMTTMIYGFNAGVDCSKITKDKSSESKVQTPNTRLIIAISAVPRREG